MRDDGIKDLTARGFSFLHHDARIEDGGFSWWPDHRKLGEFLAAHGDGDGVAGYLSLDAIADAETKLAHWRRAYRDWPQGDLWEISQLAALAARRFYITAKPLDRTTAAMALIASYFANRRQQSFEELAPGGTTPKGDARRLLLIDDATSRLVQLASLNDFGPAIVGLHNPPRRRTARRREPS